MLWCSHDCQTASTSIQNVTYLLSLTAPKTVAQTLLQQISLTLLVEDTNVRTGLVMSECQSLMVQSEPQVRKQSWTNGDHFTLYTGPGWGRY